MRLDHRWGLVVEKKRRKKRWEASAVTEGETLEVTGESAALRLALRRRTGWSDASRVVRLSRETVGWQASVQGLRSIWQFCLRCNSQSQKAGLKWHFPSAAYFHFTKCVHRSSGWLNVNLRLPSIFYYLWHSNTLLLLFKLVCVKEWNYFLNTGSAHWIM